MKDFVYNENLSSGGILCVSNEGWKIVYQLTGGNNIFNGTTAAIGADEVDECMQAFINAYALYQKIKTSIPLEGRYKTTDRMGLIIFISKDNGGVYLTEDTLTEWHLLFKDEKDLEILIKDYLKCKKKALMVQEQAIIPLIDNIDEIDKEYIAYMESHPSQVEINMSDVRSFLKVVSPRQAKSTDKLSFIFWILAALLVLCVIILIISSVSA